MGRLLFAAEHRFRSCRAHLWKLRNRGQQLASVSMVSWLFVGGVMVILAYNTLDSFFLPLGVSACILALFFLVYLQLPTVRSKFAK